MTDSTKEERVTMLDAPAQYDSTQSSIWAVGYNKGYAVGSGDEGHSQREITRLRQYLGYISRMKCHPNKGVTMTTLAAAIQLAEQALSGDLSRTHDSERQQCIDQAAEEGGS